MDSVYIAAAVFAKKKLVYKNCVRRREPKLWDIRMRRVNHSFQCCCWSGASIVKLEGQVIGNIPSRLRISTGCIQNTRLPAFGRILL